MRTALVVVLATTSSARGDHRAGTQDAERSEALRGNHPHRAGTQDAERSEALRGNHPRDDGDQEDSDPRSAFDVGGNAKPEHEAKLDCSDGLAFGCAHATDSLTDPGPFALSTWLPARSLLTLPVGDAHHDDVAHFALGAGRDEAGPTFAGANGLENRWTIEGAPADHVGTGAADTSLPLAFLDGILVTTGGFTARDRTSTGGAIDARLRRGTPDHQLEAFAWGSWTARPEPFEVAPSTFQLRRGSVRAGPTASAAVVATGPLGAALGGHAWYVAGIAPELTRTDFAWTAARVVDRDGDGVPDGAPGLVVTDPVERTSHIATTWSVPVLARAGWDRGVHHVELSLVGGARSDERFLYNSTLQAAGVDQTTWVGDAIATYHGDWTDTRARIQLGWHRALRRQSAHDPAAAGIPQLLTAYVPDQLADDPVLAAACRDAAPSMIVQCPVPIGYFASGGAGQLVDTTSDRPSLTADVAHRVGGHVLRVGGTGEDSRLVTDTRFTGGEQIRSLFPGEMSVRQLLDPSQPCSTDVAEPCSTTGRSELTYRTRYVAAYVEDTWHAAPDMQVDGGLRWELLWVGTHLRFSNQLAPRFGMAWDPLGNGASRVWASAGRSFAMLPAGVGATVNGTTPTVDTLTSPFGGLRTLASGAPVTVVPGVQALAQDEVTAGADAVVVGAVRARIWVQARRLYRGLDTTPDGFDNPGHLEEPAATRQTWLVAGELQTAPTAKLSLRVGYTYATTFGNWTGAFDPRQGAALYAGSDFDASSVNQAGYLPTDLGHRVYVEATRRGHVGPAAVYASTRLTVASGRPRDVLGDGDGGILYLLPRGSGGASPMISQADVRLGARWGGFDITLDLLNVFDRHTETSVSSLYASGAIQAIDGGTSADLVFLKDDLGRVPARRTTFDLATAYQPPFSAVLGVHRAF